MLHLTTLSSALIVGTPVRNVQSTARVAPPVMMPKFLKEAFPTLEKPDFSAMFAGFAPAPPPEPIEVKAASPLISAAGVGMAALKPLFAFEADLQALVLNLGSYDEAEVQAEIAETVSSAPVVIYSYGLSPFSTEALAVLESTGCKFENKPLGLEWFLLGPKASATRVELRKMYGQGSLPHIFIGGEWVGGLSTGADGGLSGLVESGALESKLRAARAL